MGELPVEAGSRDREAGSDPPEAGLRTLLRASYQRIRALPEERQLEECVDLLENPDLLVAEFVESCCVVEAHVAGRSARGVSTAPPEPSEAEELVLEYFYSGREIAVADGRAPGFRCIASDVLPLWGMRRGGAEREGLDYVALGVESWVDSKPRPALGAVQSAVDSTPLCVLLRLLACMAELAPKPQRERLDGELFGGALGSEPAYDLQLVLFDTASGPEVSTLHELTRDLAEVVKLSALDDPLFPRVLGAISAFRMDPDAFEGTLGLCWSV